MEQSKTAGVDELLPSRPPAPQKRKKIIDGMEFLAWLSRKWGKLALLLLLRQVREDTQLALWQPVGDGGDEFSHTAPKEVFVFAGAKITTMKLLPAEDGWVKSKGEKE